jgi:predicted amidohydrolase
LRPDTISSDIHVFSGNTPGMPSLTWVMSKFLNMGLTLEQVVAMATVNPPKVIGRGAKMGKLQVGAPADVSLLELVGTRRICRYAQQQAPGQSATQAIRCRVGRCTVRSAVPVAVRRALDGARRQDRTSSPGRLAGLRHLPVVEHIAYRKRWKRDGKRVCR